MKFDAGTKPPRVLVYGEPATGKTGAVAQLANAGYRILFFDFDRNPRVMADFLKPGHADIYIKSYAVAKMQGLAAFESNLQAVSRAAVTEMRDFGRMLKHWKTPDEDLGPSSALTAKDVVVIDSGTFLGELLLLAAQEDPDTKKDGRSLYNVAGRYYAAALDYLCGDEMGASVLVLTHAMQSGEKDAQGNFVGKPRDVPVALGEKMSKRMPTYFSDIWRLELDRAGNRQFRTAATAYEALRTSAPNKIKPIEPFDIAAMFNKLTGA